MAILAYQEIVDLIASANPASVVSFRPSESTRVRLAELIEGEKTRGLSEDERRELEQLCAARAHHAFSQSESQTTPG